MLSEARDPQVGNTFVRRAVVFDLGVGSDPVDSTTPTNLQASANGTRVALSWVAGAGAITGYVLEADSAPGLVNVAQIDLGPASNELTLTFN